MASNGTPSQGFMRASAQFDALNAHLRHLLANLKRAKKALDPDLDHPIPHLPYNQNKDIPPFGGEVPIYTGDAPGTNTGSQYGNSPSFGGG